MIKFIKNRTEGFTLIEILIVLGVLILLVGIILTTFMSFRRNQSLSLDVQKITSVLRQARNETLSSKNSTTYGVHFASTSVTLFTGPTYNAGASTNEAHSFSSGNVISNISLAGGGSDVVFIRLTGETSQNGTITLTSPSTSNTKTVTIYKTGLIEAQ